MSEPTRNEAFDNYMALLCASSPCHRTREQEREIERARDLWDLSLMRDENGSRPTH